jgi:hypothetical protein
MATLLTIPAKHVALAHTTVAALSFVVALTAGLTVWRELCENSVASMVSSLLSFSHTICPCADPLRLAGGVVSICIGNVRRTQACNLAEQRRIGDHAVSRSPFHILIALCATPRFLMLGLQWLAHRPRGRLADLELAVGLARTFSW